MRRSHRDARHDDAEALERIFRESFCDTFGHLYRREDLQMFLSRFPVAEWRRQLEDDTLEIRVGEADGVAVGFVKLAPMKLPVKASESALALDQLYILKDFHGTGIARELMGWALDQSARRSASELFLTVYIDNVRAKRFYERYGFESVGSYEFMVGNHADEDIIMRKAL